MAQIQITIAIGSYKRINKRLASTTYSKKISQKIGESYNIITNRRRKTSENTRSSRPNAIKIQSYPQIWQRKRRNHPNAKQKCSKEFLIVSWILVESCGLKEILTDTIRSRNKNKWQRSRKQHEQ